VHGTVGHGSVDRRGGGGHRLTGPTRGRRANGSRAWERGGAMELWQMDVVGGLLLADGRECKVLTLVDALRRQAGRVKRLGVR
jgi:hypothetical protein